MQILPCQKIKSKKQTKQTACVVFGGGGGLNDSFALFIYFRKKEELACLCSTHKWPLDGITESGCERFERRHLVPETQQM